MGTNQSDDYDAYLKVNGDEVLVDCHWGLLNAALAGMPEIQVIPDAVGQNKSVVEIPANIPPSAFDSPFWEDYTNRCIACGRCNFVCPTCTCFTMQDIFYTDNGK